ncbi:MAG: glycine zipper domain-containing protein [Desulfobacteraceae bacterium]|nr:glycine zipper domain-containing protein [Desulfobacteraceae bacterium]
MLRRIIVLFVIGMLVLATSCAQWQEASKKEKGAAAGAAGGAVLGGVIGRSAEATLLGGAIGGVLGYIVGNQMEKSDRTKLNQALESTPSNQTTSWTNPDTGNRYQVTPQPAYQAEGKPCRKVNLLSDVNGKTEKTEATACRENGKWVLQ